MAELIPNYCEDLLYASYRDRILIKSLGVQAGVVGVEDYKVSAGSGLQVNIKAGNTFVEQTKAIDESENTFWNGLYEVPSPVESNPSNSVTVFSGNPQIAQIILRVYDVGELKIGGSSYAKIEWLNGTENAGATKAHIEEGKASEYGAAVLPQSSFRVAYIVVPKNATKSSEFEIVDARTKASYPYIWEAVSLSSKVEHAEQTPPAVRFDLNNTVRLRGRFKVKTGQTLESLQTIVTLPTAFHPHYDMIIPIMAKKAGESFVPAGIELREEGIIALIRVASLTEGSELQFDGATFTIGV